MQKKRFPIFYEALITSSRNFKDVLYYCPTRIPTTFQQMLAIKRESKAIIAASNSFLIDEQFKHGYDEAYENQYGIYKGLMACYEKICSVVIPQERINDRIVMISNSFTGTNSGHDLGTLLASILYIRENNLEDHILGIQELGFKFPRILEILELFFTKWKVFDFEITYHCDSIDFIVVPPRFIVNEYKNPIVVSLIEEIKQKSQFYMSQQGTSTPKNAKIVLIKQKHHTNVRTHDSFEGAEFLAAMNVEGWIVLNPEFDDMRYIICLLMHASHIIVSYGAVMWTHMLFFNPNAKITFFQVGGETAYEPVLEMKYVSTVVVSDTHLDHAPNNHLLGLLNGKSKKEQWIRDNPSSQKNQEDLDLMFLELLNRQAQEDEWIHHMEHFHSQKRREFLNCDEFKLCQTRSKRTAILICGQVRHLDACFPSFQDKILNANAINTNIDIFIVTQDAETIKPRLGHGIVNQYLVNRLSPIDLKQQFESKLGSRLKAIQIRETYDTLIMSQRDDLTFSNQYGWAESFLDFSLCFDLAQTYASENGIVYDSYVRVRPDLIFANDVILYSMPTNTFLQDPYQFLDSFFICDESVAQIISEFYGYYTAETKKGRDNLLTTGIFSDCDKCEQSLEAFLKNKHVDFIDGPKMNVSVLGWLVSEIKDRTFKRFLILNKQEQLRIRKFANGLTPCIFDMKPCKG